MFGISRLVIIVKDR